ncbi:MAG TPA: hypothetical protein VHO70_10075, partial [Chitinispirillaceae bacterium]|nr:hypothetical protein [Chitinispirillaceae bacterium]
YDKQNVEIVMSEITSGEMPLVYNEEFTGKNCPKPALVDDPTTLPSITHLPDPFLMTDGTTRMTTREQWKCRRAEIKAILEKYDTGIKPDKPDKVSATLSGNKVNITVTEGSNFITMSATINYVNGVPSEPVPALIGVSMMSPGHSLPSGELSKRGIATIFFDPIQVAAHTGARNTGSFYKLYPDLTSSGNMIRWAWAVSRLIDALELLPESKIDLSRLAVSGCSYAGKVALFAGAFDERIALTLPHESGGGGTISWRYSDMLEDRDNTEVENLHHAQGAEWYASILAKYKPLSVSPNTLPYDHHELIGMIAPRAVLCIESSQIARMGGEAARIDALAARRIWKALGVADRMGATEENTGHCTWHNGFTSDLGAYLDKFLLGKEANTDILRSKFTSIDTAKWIPWETPVLK